MSKNVLITGYTQFVTDDFLINAFPNCRILVTGNAMAQNSVNNRVTVQKGPFTRESCHKAFAIYDFDQVVFFSGGIAPFEAINGQELLELSNVLEECQIQTRVLYCMGPSHMEGTSEAVLEGSTMTLCHKSAMRMDYVNIVISPWVYSLEASQPKLDDLLHPGEHDVPCAENQELTFLSSEDMALLLNRIFENWEYSAEPYVIPNAFVYTAGVLAATIMESNPNKEYVFRYTTNRAYPISKQGTSVLRNKFMWFPIYSLMEDIPLLRLRKKRSFSWKDKWEIKSKNKWIHALIRLAELLAGALITELLMLLNGISVQFKMIDYRLIYIVIIGTMYNVRMGLCAALIESISLTIAYQNEGTGWMNLFYEPTNWLPFILYMMVGAACGYVRSRNDSLLAISKGETRSITDRYNYLMQVNEDILQEKKEYKQQIIGTRDSFGKIYHIAQQLNEVHPRLLLSRALQVLETVMSSSSVAIMSTSGEKRFGRLLIASANMNIPKSMQMERYYERFRKTIDGILWVNKELDKDMPDFMYAVRKDDKIEIIIRLLNAEYSQMTLYYENLMRVVCGLISNSLINALNYQEAIMRERCIDGTHGILSDRYFLEELQIAADNRVNNKAPYILLKANEEGLSINEFEDIAVNCIRTEDIIGRYNNQYYLLLHQAEESDYPVIRKRMEARGLLTELVENERQNALLSKEETA